MKTKIFLALVIAPALLSTSCSDFLEEDNKVGETADLTYTTVSGIEGLLAGAYSFLRGWYGKEPALGLSEGGTDLFYYGYDNKQKSLMQYSISAATVSGVADNPCLDEYWEMGFAAIDVCNNLIKYAGENTQIDDATKAQYIAEGKFLRALYYFNMVNMWGALPWHDEPVTAQERNPIRTPENEIYGYILQDLDDAIAGGMATSKTSGHATIWSARALRARVLLYAASWIKGQLGESIGANDTYSSMSATDLYNAAYTEAAAVISGAGCSFYDDAADLWSMSNEDWTANNEVLFGVAYSSDLTSTVNCIPYRYGSTSDYNSLITRKGYTRGGSVMLLMFVSMWNNGLDLGGNGKNNTCVFYRATSSTDAIESAKTGESVSVAEAYSPYGRGFTRYTPSLRLWNLLSEHASTDTRYQATILDAYRIANHDLSENAANYPNMGDWADNYSGLSGSELQAFRDTAIYYANMDGDSDEGVALQAWAKNRYRLQFAYGGDIPVFTSGDEAEAEPTEGAHATSTVYGDNRYNDAKIEGRRSYPGIAKFLDNVYDSKFPTYEISYRDFFVLRLAEMYLIEAECQVATGNTSGALTTINTLRAERAISGTDNTLSSVSSVDDILTERAIELCGEYQRWFDLKRTGKLLEYVKAYNHQSATNIQSYHIYRPIPDAELNNVTNLTDEENSTTGFWQNPGY